MGLLRPFRVQGDLAAENRRGRSCGSSCTKGPQPRIGFFMFESTAASRSPPDKPFCAAGASLDEMALAVVKHLHERPESARRHAPGEALAALGNAFVQEEIVPEDRTFHLVA